MYWLWKLLESYNNCTFSTWKDMFLFNLSFWVPNLFCTFHDYGRGGTPFLASTDGPSLIFSHSDFWTTFLPCKTALPCPVKHEIFHCVEIFFIFQDFWATCGLPWKTECALNSLYWIYIFLIIQNFEQLAHALKNRVSPEIFHCIEIFLSFRIFEELAFALKTKFVMKFFAVFNIFLHSGCLSNLCLPWKTECALNSLYWMYFLSFRILNNLGLPWKTLFALKIFTAFNMVFTSRIFEQLVLALKTRVCPEFTVLNVFFILQNFEQPALALKNRVCPENCHCIEYSFQIQDFWATCACPEKQSVPWIHCIEFEYTFLSFRISNNLRLPWKTEFALKIFTVWKYFLPFMVFEQHELALKTEFALNFSSSGDGRPPAAYATVQRVFLSEIVFF